MTWEGRNLDIVTALLALGLGLCRLRVRLAWRWLLLFQLIGLGLLLNVVTIALLSAPLPFRQFTNDPPVVLVFHAPFTWIVSVHVFTALVGHLVIFRRLWRTRRDARA